MLFLSRIFLVFYFGIANSATVQAEEQVPAPVVPTEAVTAPTETETAPVPTEAAPAPVPAEAVPASADDSAEHKIRVFYRERWENAFDLRAITIAKQSHYLMGAQWNRKASFGSMIGIGAIGTPTNATIRKNGVKDTYSIYGLGGFIAHQIFDFRPFRLIAFVSAGQGILYHRNEVAGAEPTFGGAKFTYLDPGIYLTFYSWKSIDIGLSASAFAAKFEKNKHVEDSDLGGATAGLTFRKLYH